MQFLALVDLIKAAASSNNTECKNMTNSNVSPSKSFTDKTVLYLNRGAELCASEACIYGKPGHFT